MVQHLKLVMEDVKEEFRLWDDKIDAKIDSLIQIQKDHLQLERECLNFEHEKAGLPCLPEN